MAGSKKARRMDAAGPLPQKNVVRADQAALRPGGLTGLLP
jgi:hypothetical protein